MYKHWAVWKGRKGRERERETERDRERKREISYVRLYEVLLLYTIICVAILCTYKYMCFTCANIFALGEWYSCRGLALVANSGVSTLGFKHFNTYRPIVLIDDNKIQKLFFSVFVYTELAMVLNGRNHIVRLYLVNSIHILTGLFVNMVSILRVILSFVLSRDCCFALRN